MTVIPLPMKKGPISKMPNLLILAGIPGCGKSTWAKNYFDLMYAVVSSDRIRKEIFGSLKDAHRPEVKKDANRRVFEKFHDDIRTKLEFGVDVIADATSLTAESRTKLRDIGRAVPAKVHLVLFKNVAEALLRNEQREEDQRVPLDVMNHMLKKYLKTLADYSWEDYDSIIEIESVK